MTEVVGDLQRGLGSAAPNGEQWLHMTAAARREVGRGGAKGKAGMASIQHAGAFIQSTGD
jgi:hypothetical protein